jgi:hypothetical protein
VNPADRTEIIIATVLGTNVTALIPVKVTSTTSGPAASALILGSSAAAIKPDGSTTATITATVVDTNNLPVSGATVKFSATSGQLGASSGPSSATGTVTISYSALSSSSPVNPADRTETITASVVGTSIAAQIPIRVTSSTAPPASAAAINLASSAAAIKADGSTTTTITATVVDANNLPVSGATLKFLASAGQLGVSSGVTAASGTVTISYSALGSSGAVNPSDRTETITASVVGTNISAQIPIKVTASLLSLALSSSVPAIKTDGSNTTTITATVFDSSNLAVPGQNVKFTAPSGQLGISSGVSSALGVVTIPFTAIFANGNGDRTNRTEIITANILGTTVTAQIPIQVTGSTLTLNSAQSITQVGSSVSFTATAKDAASVGVNAQSIRFSIDNKSTGSGILSVAQTTTGSSGSTPSVTLTGNAPGTVIVNADWLNSAGNSTLTASMSVSVNSPGISFAIVSPTTNPTSLTLSASKAISVSVPTFISGVAVANVRFATTLGTWSNSTKSSTLVPVGNSVTETLTAGANAGNANIQIDARDSSGNVLATLNRVFALSSATGTQISLQPSVSTVAPSTSGTTNTTTLTATVRDAGNNAVGNVPVLFEIVNPTGSGEQISPVIAYTNTSGQATSIFSSGALSTVGGLQIRASLVGTAVADTKTINVAGSSVSVTVGQANVINSTDTSTTYTLPMSVLVVSSTGAAVSGATVTLSAFPTSYYRGSRDSLCTPVYSSGAVTVPGIVTAGVTTAFPNEDVNEDDILEAGEDYDPKGDGRGVGTITPPHASAGTLPPTVVTNASGVGTFNLIYLKNYAQWIQSRVRAKVVVNGSEFANDLKFDLPAASVDMIPICTLPNSPFGP